MPTLRHLWLEHLRHEKQGLKAGASNRWQYTDLPLLLRLPGHFFGAPQYCVGDKIAHRIVGSSDPEVDGRPTSVVADELAQSRFKR